MTLAMAACAALVIQFSGIPMGPAPAAAEAQSAWIIALTADGRLLHFESARPDMVHMDVQISGLPAGERILGIDVRPATGELFALGSGSRLYVVDPTTGGAMAVGAAPFSPALEGASFGFDFNPTVDRIRVVSDTGQNLRLHPDTGEVAAVDGTISFTPGDMSAGHMPMAGAAGYTNSMAGATSTALYLIDSTSDALVLQDPPNDGLLSTIGMLGMDIDGPAGFDIAPDGTAYAVVMVYSGMNASPEAHFGAIDLTSGMMSPIGRIGMGEAVVGIAIHSY